MHNHYTLSSHANLEAGPGEKLHYNKVSILFVDLSSTKKPIFLYFSLET
jgi:hypothetical protein